MESKEIKPVEIKKLSRKQFLYWGIVSFLTGSGGLAGVLAESQFGLLSKFLKPHPEETPWEDKLRVETVPPEKAQTPTAPSTSRELNIPRKADPNVVSTSTKRPPETLEATKTATSKPVEEKTATGTARPTGTNTPTTEKSTSTPQKTNTLVSPEIEKKWENLQKNTVRVVLSDLRHEKYPPKEFINTTKVLVLKMREKELLGLIELIPLPPAKPTIPGFTPTPVPIEEQIILKPNSVFDFIKRTYNPEVLPNPNELANPLASAILWALSKANLSEVTAVRTAISNYPIEGIPEEFWVEIVEFPKNREENLLVFNEGRENVVIHIKIQTENTNSGRAKAEVLYCWAEKEKAIASSPS